MTRRMVGLLAIVFALSILMVACSGNGPDGEAQVTDDGIVAPEDAMIGVSMYTLGAPYFAAQEQAARRKAEELGIRFASTNAEGDMGKQIADVEDLLAQGIDLLILNPLDSEGLIPATEMARDAGVPVVIIDSSIDSSAYFVTTVQSHNLRNGELVGEWLQQQMGNTPIRMALLSGAQGNPVGKERRQGVFRGIIEEQLRTIGSSSFEIVSQGWGNWAHEGGLNAMEDILVAHPDINVLLAENDSMALGAMLAIEEAGLSDDILVLAAADGQKEALELIREGSYGATGLNDPALIARTGIEIGLRVLAGETDFPAVSYTPPAVITQENVDQYYDPDAVF